MKSYPKEWFGVSSWGNIYEIEDIVPMCGPNCCGANARHWLQLRNVKTNEISDGHASWYKPLTKIAKDFLQSRLAPHC